MSTQVTTKSKVSRHDIRKSLTRKQIAFAAFYEMADAEIEGLAIQKVMKRSGYAFNTFYNHFADREALVQGVIEEVFLPWWRGFMEKVPHDTDPAVYLGLLLRVLVGEFQDNSSMCDFVRRNTSFVLAHHSQASFPDEENDAVSRGIQSGRFKAVSETFARTQVFSLMAATASLIRLGEAPGDIAEITAGTILRMLEISEADIETIMTMPLPKTSSLEEVMKFELSQAINLGLARTKLPFSSTL